MESLEHRRWWLLAAIATACACAAAGDETIFAANQPATLCIEVTGKLYNGSEEVAGRGSGFFLNDQRSALTNSHILPDFNRYQSVRIQGKVRTDDEIPDLVVALTLKHQDADLDLALLEADAPIPSRYVLHGDSRRIRPGVRLIVLGCPLNYGPTLTEGKVGNTRDGPLGRWLVDAPINPGNSGGPVFTEAGELIGVSWGGIRKTADGTPIYGLNYVIPIHQAIDGVLRNQNIKIYSGPSLAAKPASTAAATNAAAPFPMARAEPSAVSPRFDPAPRLGATAGRSAIARSTAPSGTGARAPLPRVTMASPELAPEMPVHPLPQKAVKRMSRAFEIRQRQDDHPEASPSTKTYTLKFAADPGFKFSDFQFGELSRNHGSPPIIQASPDAREISVTFSLTSGPMFDRYGGWLDGTLVTRQTRE